MLILVRFKRLAPVSLTVLTRSLDLSFEDRVLLQKQYDCFAVYLRHEARYQVTVVKVETKLYKER